MTAANDFPAPLTPADCDLRGFQFMPLDVGRLRDSKLASHVPPAQCWFAVILWCASWHQVPAASLPDDDIELARLAGFGFVVKEWKKVRAGALHGWVKCSDGRLYHPVVAEKALDAWQSKHEHRWKSECARIKKHNQRHESSIPYPTLDEFMSPNYVDPTKGDKRPLSPGTGEEGPEFVSGTLDPRDRERRDKGQGEGKDSKPSGSSEVVGTPHGSRFPDDHVPTTVQDWVEFFDREHGVETDTSSLHGRKKFWPLAHDWIAAGLSIGRMREVIAKAKADSDEQIMYLPSYVNSVLINAQARANTPPKPPPLHSMTDTQLNAEGVRVGAGQARPGESRHDFIARIQAAQAAAQGRPTA